MRKRRPDTIMSSEAEEEPVSVLQRFEKRLEGLVEGAFAKVFKGVVHPVEILNAMQREAEAHKAILAGGRTLVPNRYVIDLSPYDHSRLAPYAAALAQELAQSQAEFIGEQAWTVYGDVIVEIERGEGLDTGMFRVTAEVYTGGEVAPVQQPAYDAGPQYPPYDQHQGGYQQHGASNGRGVGLVSGDGRTYPLQMGSTVIGRGDQANLQGAVTRYGQRDATRQREPARRLVPVLGELLHQRPDRGGPNRRRPRVTVRNRLREKETHVPVELGHRAGRQPPLLDLVRQPVLVDL